MSRILRYKTIQTVTTRRDPFLDLLGWISGLRSIGYTRDILTSIHGRSASESKNEALAVRAHVDTAIQLFEQAELSAPEVSFLPLYYAILNLSKIYVILGGKLSDLESQRYHGVSNPRATRARDLMTDAVIIRARGAIPLLYSVITGTQVPRGHVRLTMRDVYPFIMQISYEFGEAYSTMPKLATLYVMFEHNETKGHRLSAQVGVLVPGTPMPRKNDLRILTGFARDSARAGSYVTPWFQGNAEPARTQLLLGLRRYLMYCVPGTENDMRTLTPISSRQLLFPEELPIVLAFFHMSNVVRYNPEFLARLKDSRAWAMLLTLRQHAPLTFLELFWAHVTRKHLIIS